MTDELSIRVNFSRPMPLFPLGQVVMLPQQVTPLHIFEPRYKQMISRALDGSGQIAIARIDGDLVTGPRPPLRPAVCVGQIVQHETLEGGRYNIMLQGVCRARIIEEEDLDEDRMYRQAMLEPVNEDDDPSAAADGFRSWLADMLAHEELSRLNAADELLKLVENQEIPPPVLVEIISFVLVNDDLTRYALLKEGRVEPRVRLVRDHLEDTIRLIRQAVSQKPGDWPKGLSWN